MTVLLFAAIVVLLALAIVGTAFLVVAMLVHGWWESRP